MTSQSSCAVPSVVSWQSARFGCHAASKPYARIVRAVLSESDVFWTLKLTRQPGQANLPSSCPVCEHSPLSAEDCSPNKSLRTTIRVFLRTEEKKREASRPKVIEDIASETQTVAAKATAPSAGQSAAEQSAKSSAPAAGDGGIGSSDSAQAPQHGLAKSVIGETAQVRTSVEQL